MDYLHCSHRPIHFGFGGLLRTVVVPGPAAAPAEHHRTPSCSKTRQLKCQAVLGAAPRRRPRTPGSNTPMARGWDVSDPCSKKGPPVPSFTHTIYPAPTSTDRQHRGTGRPRAGTACSSGRQVGLGANEGVIGLGRRLRSQSWMEIPGSKKRMLAECC